MKKVYYCLYPFKTWASTLPPNIRWGFSKPILKQVLNYLHRTECLKCFANTLITWQQSQLLQTC